MQTFEFVFFVPGDELRRWSIINYSVLINNTINLRFKLDRQAHNFKPKWLFPSAFDFSTDFWTYFTIHTDAHSTPAPVFNVCTPAITAIYSDFRVMLLVKRYVQVFCSIFYKVELLLMILTSQIRIFPKFLHENKPALSKDVFQRRISRQPWIAKSAILNFQQR